MANSSVFQLFCHSGLSGVFLYEIDLFTKIGVLIRLTKYGAFTGRDQGYEGNS
jgi:hypothetical protein